MLLGAQSVTGKAIAKGDIIGVSVLSMNQEDVKDKLGDNHSDVVDKFASDYKLTEAPFLSPEQASIW